MAASGSDRAQRDARVLSDLYEEYYDRVARYIATRIGNPDLAQDLAGEVFLRWNPWATSSAVESPRRRGFSALPITWLWITTVEARTGRASPWTRPSLPWTRQTTTARWSRS